MKSRKWLYNFVGWKPQLGYIPLLAVLGIQGQASKWFMQRVGEYAWSLIAAHPWPCRQGLAPLDHLCTCTAHHGLWVWEGSLLARTQSLKTKRLWRSWIMQLFRLWCSLKNVFFGHIWRCDKPQCLSTRGPCRSVGLGKSSVQAGFTAGGRLWWLLILYLSNYQE